MALKDKKSDRSSVIKEKKNHKFLGVKSKTEFFKKKSVNINSAKKKNKNIVIKRQSIQKNLKNIKFRKYFKKNEKKYLSQQEKKNIQINRKIKNCFLVHSALRQVFKKPIKNINKIVNIGFFITISDLADKMSIKKEKVLKTIKKIGLNNSIKNVLDQETAQLIAEEMGYKVILHADNKLELSLLKERDFILKKNLQERSPIITIMGHVDHGKTSLLDKIRTTNLVKKEFGGITQHIGAYLLKTKNGNITFIDTPGHAAFTAMRARGAKLTDIIILVVAADDGVMPQTIEAIKHSKFFNVPVIVAINKIDKIESNIKKIKKDLLKYSIVSEDFGGNNIFVNLSAKTGVGISDLLQAIYLQAEILELKVSHTGMASGVILESFLDKGYGPAASLIVTEGCLQKNDVFICGFEYGKIRVIQDENRKEILKAGPSMPIIIYGFSGLPKTGDVFLIVKNEKKARNVALYRRFKDREERFLNVKRKNIENLFKNIKKDVNTTLNIILKTDTHGSLEAILDSLIGLSNSYFTLNIISSGVGAITETDASLCMTSHSILLGFNVRADISAKRLIDSEKLDLRYYSIIYNLIDDIKLCLKGLLKPLKKQKIIGLAEVRSIFKSPKFGLIAGCIVLQGVVKKTNPIRILRDNIVIYEGYLESLRRFKEDVIEVRTNIECGIGIKNYHKIQIRDQIEVFKIFS
ncbi:translation initiation factor IF-2 [Buchnera aphidicola]|uniref:translation initiation factor IF-2 n=1 Tax=Buchnera aphidicola TaxID=9 RepID=UPI0031B7076D